MFNFIFSNFMLFSSKKLISNSAATRKYCEDRAQIGSIVKWQAIFKSSMNTQLNADSEQNTYEF